MSIIDFTKTLIEQGQNIIDVMEQTSKDNRYLVISGQTDEERQELDELLHKQAQSGVKVTEYQNPLTLGFVETSQCLLNYARFNNKGTPEIDRAIDEMIDMDTDKYLAEHPEVVTEVIELGLNVDE